MSDTLDSVPGTWTLWVRTNDNQQTATYQASFVASGAGSSAGQVTVTGDGGSQTGTWEETDSPVDENVKIWIDDPAGSGKPFYFSGHMVGLAMGGTIAYGINPLPSGAWAGYKTSD